MNKEFNDVTDVVAIRNGEEIKLKYLGGQGENSRGMNDYLPDYGSIKKVFENRPGVVLLLIGYLYHCQCPEELKEKIESNKELIQTFIQKWYDKGLPTEIDLKIFPFFDSLNWVDEDGEDRINYYNEENNIRLLFSKPDDIADWPVFIKREYYTDLIKDLKELYLQLKS